MSDFEKFKEVLPSKEKFYIVRSQVKKLLTKNINMFLMFGKNLK